MSITPFTFPPKILGVPLKSTGLRLVMPDIEHWDGNDLVVGELGTVIYATLMNFTKTQMEIIELDATTIDVATTIGFLINKRALSFNGGTMADVETAYDWTADQTYIQIGTNPPQMLANMVDLDETQTITGKKIFPASEANRPRALLAQDTAVDEAYITLSQLNAVVLAGAGYASEDQFGLVELAKEEEEEYGFDTNGDISAAVLIRALDVSAKTSYPDAVYFRADGLKMYTISGVNVLEYDLTTAWDISTGSWLQTFDCTAKQASGEGITFSPDGEKMYTISRTSSCVNEWDLSTAWDISSAVWLQTLDVSAKIVWESGITFKTDGTKMYITDDSSDDITEYALSTAWDISSATYTDELDVSTGGLAPRGCYISNDGLKMYVTDIYNYAIQEYLMSTAWDISTATASNDIDLSAVITYPSGIFLSPNLEHVYIGEQWDETIVQYQIPRAIVSRPSKVAQVIQENSHTFAEDGEATDAYKIYTDPPLRTLKKGVGTTFLPTTANTTACSLNWDGTGAKAIKKYVSGALADLETGDIIATMPVKVIYDGTQYIMLNPGGTTPTTALLTEMATFFGATDMTGAEAEELTDGSETTKHKHTSIIGVDLGASALVDPASETVITTIAVGAGLLGANNGMRITFNFVVVTGASNPVPIIKVKFGTTTFATLTGAAGADWPVGRAEIIIMNNADQAVQNARAMWLTGAVTDTFEDNNTGTEDTTGALNLTITGEADNNVSTITLYNVVVERL